VPIYEYRCAKCGEVFEALQKFSDAPLSNCKFCDGTVERLISSSSFQLKGSGWYLTDYAKKSSSAPKESSGNGKPGDGKPADGKSGDKGGDAAGSSAKPGASDSAKNTPPTTSKE
jgi:putative FmdB family regulatory protein